MEYFAGVGNLCCAVSREYPAARVDIEYDTDHQKQGEHKQSPMDFLSSAGYTILAENTGTIFGFMCMGMSKHSWLQNICELRVGNCWYDFNILLEIHQ